MRRFVRFFILLQVFIFAAAPSLSRATSYNAKTGADVQVTIKSTYGSPIRLDVYNPGLPSLVVIGPGRGCGYKRGLYAPIATEAKAKGYSLIRVYWAYCLVDPENGEPSKDLSKEAEDLRAAINYAKTKYDYKDAQIAIAGKSLGTVIGARVFNANPALRALVMVTPPCSAAKVDPNPGSNLLKAHYPGLANEKRPVLLVQGDIDEHCTAEHYKGFFGHPGTHVSSLVLHGDHDLRVGTVSADLVSADLAKSVETANITRLSKWIFSNLN